MLAWAGLLLLAPVAHAETPPAITMAGTFNNWNTLDEDYRLKHIDGDRYELVRFWPCGTYEFKFVFGGTWDRHLGDVGGGKLGQPGADVRLEIPQSKTYAISLDLAGNEWRITPRAPDRPRAVIRLYDEVTGKVRLDGTGSESREGHPIREYLWHVSRAGRGDPIETHGAGWRLEVIETDAPGKAWLLPACYEDDYTIELTVRDGVMEDKATLTRKLHSGWRWVLPWTYNDPPMRYPLDLTMYPIAADRFVGSFVVAKTVDMDLFVETVACDYREMFAVHATRPSHLQQDEPYFVLFDAAQKSISLEQTGWKAISVQVGTSPPPIPISQYVPDLTDYRRDLNLPKGLMVETVDAVGDFNGWRPGVHRLFSADDGSVYRGIIPLSEGVHHYKFVINGVLWRADPAADSRFNQPDGHGGTNSGVLIGDDAAKFEAAKADDITSDAVRHDPASEFYFSPISGQLASITVRALADDLASVEWVPAGAEAAPVSLRRIETRYGFDYWGGLLRTENATAEYRFRLADGAARRWLAADGLKSEEAPAGRPFTRETTMHFRTPDWAKTAVWYQIFPERFRNGDPGNDPPRTVPWGHEWYKAYRGPRVNRLPNTPPGPPLAGGEKEPATLAGGEEPPTPLTGEKEPAAARHDAFEEKGDFYEYIYDRRYGGDLQGVQEKLPYLRDLGVTAIYFNPIFLAESLHKYDASDYRHIDDFFGVKGSLHRIKGETIDPKTWKWSESDRVFLNFLKEAHRQGFKVIIDGVFNHTGREFWAFQDVLKNGNDSAYADWFDITNWKPFEYLAWDKPNGALPRLKHDDKLGLAKPVREHLFAVTRRWMDPDGDGDPSDGIDGWRLDVAADINEHFWKDWRKLVKSINPDAYIVGELWQESRQWLDGRTFDAVMNYPFAERCQRFFVNHKKRTHATKFGDELLEMLGWYKPQVNYVLQNLFDSHDTDRVASMFMNPDLEYDKANRLQDNGPKYDPSKPTAECHQRLALMVTFQMTFLGAPMVYYGDEVGMYGADDPSCRKPMLWADLMPFDDPKERLEAGVFGHYRRMIAIRNALPALQLGSFEILHTDDRKGVFAFARSLDNETVVVVLNNSGKNHRVNVPSPWPDGARVVRLDDPATCEVLGAAEGDPAGRPRIRVIPPTGKSGLVVREGRLRGAMLEPWTAAVVVSAE